MLYPREYGTSMATLLNSCCGPYSPSCGLRIDWKALRAESGNCGPVQRYASVPRMLSVTQFEVPMRNLDMSYLLYTNEKTYQNP